MAVNEKLHFENVGKMAEKVVEKSVSDGILEAVFGQTYIEAWV